MPLFGRGRHSVPEGGDSTADAKAKAEAERRGKHTPKHSAKGTAKDTGKIGQRRDPKTAGDPE